MTYSEKVTIQELSKFITGGFTRLNPKSIPSDKGVYVHFNLESGAMLYCGSGTGANGLKRRLGDVTRWVAQARADAEYRPHTQWAPVIDGLAKTPYETWFVKFADRPAALAAELKLQHLHIELTGTRQPLKGWSV
jgi:hypothetical protein